MQSHNPALRNSNNKWSNPTTTNNLNLSLPPTNNHNLHRSQLHQLTHDEP
jgi:hypothetical protein